MRTMKLEFGWIRGRRRGEPGQALVEAAIAAPIFFVLLLGAAELARVAYVAIEVSNAARAAVQYASQDEHTMGDITGITLAAKSDGYDANQMSGITATRSEPGYMCADGTTAYTVDPANGPTCNSGATCIPTVTVTTSATFDPLIHLPGLPSTFSINGRATSVCVDCQ